jgi:hypothetical protein
MFASTWDLEELMNWKREALEVETIATVDAVVCTQTAASPQNNVTPAEITVRKLHASA